MTPRTLDFSRPLPVFDEETFEYQGYWMNPDGTIAKTPEHSSGEPTERAHTD